MARIFDGNSANHLLASGLSYALPTNCTIVWRAKTSSNTSDIFIVGRRDSGGSGWGIYRTPSGSTAVFIAFGIATYNFDTSAWAADGAYHTFVLTKTGTNLAFYVDGIAKGTASISLNNGSGTNIGLGAFIDGTDSNTAKSGWNGGIYDFALFPSVLDSTARASFDSGITPDLLGVTADHIWLLNNASAGNESDSAGSQTLTEVGTVGYEATGSNPNIVANQGSLSLTGQIASLKVAHILLANQGSYTYTGQNATLTYGQPGVYTLSANAGSYAITGSDGLAQRAMNAVYGTYAINGRNASLRGPGDVLLGNTQKTLSMAMSMGL